jgi:hypothetical protein
MKSVVKISVLILILFVTSRTTIWAQLDSVMTECEKHLTEEYLSDGQQYISLITGEQTAEFNAVFYGGNTYRLITCGGEKQNLLFTIFDINRNELFNNSDYEKTNFWDIQFESTIECFVEVKLDAVNTNSGFAVLLIGLKK